MIAGLARVMASHSIIIITKTKPLWFPLVITSLQVQDLINCFLDEDSHLKKFCLHRPYSHDSGWVTGLVAVPADRERAG